MRIREGAPLPLYRSWLRIILIYVKVDYLTIKALNK